jgi:hypothetical protein
MPSRQLHGAAIAASSRGGTTRAPQAERRYFRDEWAFLSVIDLDHIDKDVNFCALLR